MGSTHATCLRSRLLLRERGRSALMFSFSILTYKASIMANPILSRGRSKPQCSSDSTLSVFKFQVAVTIMAYVPPHKRHLKERDGLSSVPTTLAWRFKKGLNPRPLETNARQSGKIEHADTAIYRWLALGLDDDGYHPPASALLRLISVKAIEGPGHKWRALAKTCAVNEENEMGRDQRKKPWVHIAETVMQDLVSSFQKLRSEIKDQSIGEIKPTLVARIGNVLFLGSPSSPVETCGHTVTEASLKRLRRSFHTNLPSYYTENVTHKVIPEIGLSFQDEKDIYHVELSDKSKPGAIICCKCSVFKAEQSLELYKANPFSSPHNESLCQILPYL